ncbi:hypothetical protein DPEC_G00230120 [Dallia pectoralis]|uniref:Uncharacterized protein n=1 Tax=Dallia pectoralis TaxID=75939 RepID=A0ACC2G1Y0_DALPE|nr:hypothetical protein DPEC_G00230120 [Dallia pectoralis]
MSYYTDIIQEPPQTVLLRSFQIENCTSCEGVEYSCIPVTTGMKTFPTRRQNYTHTGSGASENGPVWNHSAVRT